MQSSLGRISCLCSSGCGGRQVGDESARETLRPREGGRQVGWERESGGRDFHSELRTLACWVSLLSPLTSLGSASSPVQRESYELIRSIVLAGLVGFERKPLGSRWAEGPRASGQGQKGVLKPPPDRPAAAVRGAGPPGTTVGPGQDGDHVHALPGALQRPDAPPAPLPRLWLREYSRQHLSPHLSLVGLHPPSPGALQSPHQLCRPEPMPPRGAGC